MTSGRADPGPCPSGAFRPCEDAAILWRSRVRCTSTAAAPASRLTRTAAPAAKSRLASSARGTEVSPRTVTSYPASAWMGNGGGAQVVRRCRQPRPVTKGATAAETSLAARALLRGPRASSSPKQASGPLERRPAARAPSCEARPVDCAAAPSRTHPAARRGSRGFGRPARTGPGRGLTGSARTPAGTPRQPPRLRVRVR